MNRFVLKPFLIFTIVFCILQTLSANEIVIGAKTTIIEKLAANEIRRYVYLRTGEILPINNKVPLRKDAIIIFIDPSMGQQEYSLKTNIENDQKRLIITGGSDIAVLYGAYHFAEKLGVRFYLHGDVIPDERISFEIPELDETHNPLFDVRGLNPWGTHSEGFDLWNKQDWKQVLSQMVKLRMNFVGIHCYNHHDNKNYNPEPTVWLGLEDEFDSDGKVLQSYPVDYFNTLRTTVGYTSTKTGDFSYGCSQLFERDDWGPDVMSGYSPAPTNMEGQNEIFNRTGELYSEVFEFAGMLGIKTAVGTETPMKLDDDLKARLQKMNLDTSDSSVISGLYKGAFKRIMATHKLDYFWLWTPEDWTWKGNSQEEFNATIKDIELAQKALHDVKAPFQLATAGWVLGPTHDRAALDKLLSKDIPFSAISRNVGHVEIETAFGEIRDREKWAIPWLEDDVAMTSPQLWVGRTRVDAFTALKYGCNGLIGLHWRTRGLSPQVSALAQAGWEQPWELKLNEMFNPDFFSSDEMPEERGKIANSGDVQIDGTIEDTIYQTYRYGLSHYKQNIPSGKYSVTLKFYEPYFNEKGKRVFDVKVQGKTVLNEFDIFSRVGKFSALDYTVPDVVVNDGVLKIEFVPKHSLPVIAAIVINGNTFAANQFVSEPYTKKINCGGPDSDGFITDIDLFPGNSNELQERDETGPTEDFYADWALHMFGKEVSARIAGIFSKIDGRLPKTSKWGPGAGAIMPIYESWDEMQDKWFGFLNELESIRSDVRGVGNLQRYEYWLNTFRYQRAQAKVGVSMATFFSIIKDVEAMENPDDQKELANEKALPAYQAIVSAFGEACNYQLAATSTYGEIGTILNLQGKNWPDIYFKTGKWLEKILGKTVTERIRPIKEYLGKPRLIVPTVPSHVYKEEQLKLKVIILDRDMAKNAFLFWRPMGKGKYKKIELKHVARAVYTVTLPPAKDMGVEYYIQAITSSGESLHYPVTAPSINNTVITVN